MSTVSNRFYVECIDDGATLHGQLLSNKSLTQAWTGTTAVPNWTTAANQPTIYVDLLDGNTSVEPDSGGTWYYNGVALEFDSTTHIDTTGKFEEVFPGKPFLKEFVLKPKEFPGLMQKRLEEAGFFAALDTEEGYVTFCVTEKHGKAEIDRLVSVIKEG